MFGKIESRDHAQEQLAAYKKLLDKIEAGAESDWTGANTITADEIKQYLNLKVELSDAAEYGIGRADITSATAAERKLLEEFAPTVLEPGTETAKLGAVKLMTGVPAHKWEVDELLNAISSKGGGKNVPHHLRMTTYKAVPELKIQEIPEWQERAEHTQADIKRIYEGIEHRLKASTIMQERAALYKEEKAAYQKRIDDFKAEALRKAQPTLGQTIKGVAKGVGNIITGSGNVIVNAASAGYNAANFGKEKGILGDLVGAGAKATFAGAKQTYSEMTGKPVSGVGTGFASAAADVAGAAARKIIPGAGIAVDAYKTGKAIYGLSSALDDVYNAGESIAEAVREYKHPTTEPVPENLLKFKSEVLATPIKEPAKPGPEVTKVNLPFADKLLYKKTLEHKFAVYTEATEDEKEYIKLKTETSNMYNRLINKFERMRTDLAGQPRKVKQFDLEEYELYKQRADKKKFETQEAAKRQADIDAKMEASEAKKYPKSFYEVGQWQAKPEARKEVAKEIGIVKPPPLRTFSDVGKENILAALTAKADADLLASQAKEIPKAEKKRLQDLARFKNELIFGESGVAEQRMRGPVELLTGLPAKMKYTGPWNEDPQGVFPNPAKPGPWRVDPAHSVGAELTKIQDDIIKARSKIISTGKQLTVKEYEKLFKHEPTINKDYLPRGKKNYPKGKKSSIPFGWRGLDIAEEFLTEAYVEPRRKMVEGNFAKTKGGKPVLFENLAEQQLIEDMPDVAPPPRAIMPLEEGDKPRGGALESADIIKYIEGNKYRPDPTEPLFARSKAAQTIKYHLPQELKPGFDFTEELADENWEPPIKPAVVSGDSGAEYEPRPLDMKSIRQFQDAKARLDELENLISQTPARPPTPEIEPAPSPARSPSPELGREQTISPATLERLLGPDTPPTTPPRSRTTSVGSVAEFEPDTLPWVGSSTSSRRSSISSEGSIRRYDPYQMTWISPDSEPSSRSESPSPLTPIKSSKPPIAPKPAMTPAIEAALRKKPQAPQSIPSADIKRITVGEGESEALYAVPDKKPPARTRVTSEGFLESDVTMINRGRSMLQDIDEALGRKPREPQPQFIPSENIRHVTDIRPNAEGVLEEVTYALPGAKPATTPTVEDPYSTLPSPPGTAPGSRRPSIVVEDPYSTLPSPPASPAGSRRSSLTADLGTHVPTIEYPGERPPDVMNMPTPPLVSEMEASREEQRRLAEAGRITPGKVAHEEYEKTTEYTINKLFPNFKGEYDPEAEDTFDIKPESERAKKTKFNTMWEKALRFTGRKTREMLDVSLSNPTVAHKARNIIRTITGMPKYKAIEPRKEPLLSSAFLPSDRAMIDRANAMVKEIDDTLMSAAKKQGKTYARPQPYGISQPRVEEELFEGDWVMPTRYDIARADADIAASKTSKPSKTPTPSSSESSKSPTASLLEEPIGEAAKKTTVASNNPFFEGMTEAEIADIEGSSRKPKAFTPSWWKSKITAKPRAQGKAGVNPFFEDIAAGGQEPLRPTAYPESKNPFAEAASAYPERQNPFAEDLDYPEEKNPFAGNKKVTSFDNPVYTDEPVPGLTRQKPTAVPEPAKPPKGSLYFDNPAYEELDPLLADLSPEELRFVLGQDVSRPPTPVSEAGEILVEVHRTQGGDRPPVTPSTGPQRRTGGVRGAPPSDVIEKLPPAPDKTISDQDWMTQEEKDFVNKPASQEKMVEFPTAGKRYVKNKYTGEIKNLTQRRAQTLVGEGEWEWAPPGDIFEETDFDMPPSKPRALTPPPTPRAATPPPRAPTPPPSPKAPSIASRGSSSSNLSEILSQHKLSRTPSEASDISDFLSQYDKTPARERTPSATSIASEVPSAAGLRSRSGSISSASSAKSLESLFPAAFLESSESPRGRTPSISSSDSAKSFEELLKFLDSPQRVATPESPAKIPAMKAPWKIGPLEPELTTEATSFVNPSYKGLQPVQIREAQLKRMGGVPEPPPPKPGELPAAWEGIPMTEEMRRHRERIKPRAEFNRELPKSLMQMEREKRDAARALADAAKVVKPPAKPPAKPKAEGPSLMTKVIDALSPKGEYIINEKPPRPIRDVEVVRSEEPQRGRRKGVGPFIKPTPAVDPEMVEFQERLNQLRSGDVAPDVAPDIAQLAEDTRSLRSSLVSEFVGQKPEPKRPGPTVNFPMSLSDIEMQIEPEVKAKGPSLFSRLSGMVPRLPSRGKYELAGSRAASPAGSPAASLAGSDVGLLSGLFQKRPGTGPTVSPRGGSKPSPISYTPMTNLGVEPVSEIGGLAETSFSPPSASRPISVTNWARGGTGFEGVGTGLLGPGSLSTGSLDTISLDSMPTPLAGGLPAAPQRSGILEGLSKAFRGLVPQRGSYDVTQPEPSIAGSSLGSTASSDAPLLGGLKKTLGGIKMPSLGGLKMPSLKMPSFGMPTMPSFGGAKPQPSFDRTGFVPMTNLTPSTPEIGGMAETSFITPAGATTPPKPAVRPTAKPAALAATAPKGGTAANIANVAGIGLTAAGAITSAVFGGLSFGMMKESMALQKELANKPMAPQEKEEEEELYGRDPKTGRPRLSI